MKTGRERSQDTLSYLEQQGMAVLANDIRTLASAYLDALGEELSLEHARLFPTEAGTSRRRALRALLLCQRVYLSELWPKYTGIGATLGPTRYLPNDWKRTSLLHWYQQPEPQILDGIQAYTVTTDNANGLSAIATAGHPGGLPTNGLTVTRSQRFDGGPSCYRAVMIWLFRSGLVSYRWFVRYNGVDNEQSLTAAFGSGQTVWPANSAEFRLVADGQPQIGLNGVAPNRIVHLYSETPGRWNGHWLISMGGGRAIGCNNDTESEHGRVFGRPVVPNPYSNQCTLNGQFLAYKERQGPLYERGVAVVFDPLALPDRM